MGVKGVKGDSSIVSSSNGVESPGTAEVPDATAGESTKLDEAILAIDGLQDPGIDGPATTAPSEVVDKEGLHFMGGRDDLFGAEKELGRRFDANKDVCTDREAVESC
jgi:hypothetical protein